MAIRNLKGRATSLSPNSGKPHVGSSADVLKYIGVTDATIALKAFAIMKAAGYIPQDKFDEAVKLAKTLK